MKEIFGYDTRMFNDQKLEEMKRNIELQKLNRDGEVPIEVSPTSATCFLGLDAHSKRPSPPKKPL